MTCKNLLKLLFYINLGIVGLLVGYKIYLNLFALELEALHSIRNAGHDDPGGHGGRAAGGCRALQQN